MSPFSLRTRNEIKDRAHNASELSYRTDRPTHAMHFNHTKNGEYDTPARGILVTIAEHLAFHLLFVGQEQNLGLKRCQNDWAIDKLNRTCVDYYHSIGQLDKMDEEVQEAKDMWYNYFMDGQ